MIDYQVTLLKSNMGKISELAKTPTKIGAMNHVAAAEAYAEAYDMDGDDIAYGEEIEVSVSGDGVTKIFKLRGKMTAHYAAFEMEKT